MSEKSSKIVKNSHFSIYYLVPIIALIISAILIWSNTISRGKTISLIMNDASGIEVGKTLVKYRSVNVGTVKSVNLTEDFSRAIAKIEMYPDTDSLLNEDSVFWIEKPRIQTNSITGLDTLISGSYIRVSKGKSPIMSDIFTVVDNVPVGVDENGVVLKLDSMLSTNIPSGTNINYHGFSIGVVIDSKYDLNEQKTIYNIIIKKPYDRLIDTNSVFWLDSGFAFEFGPKGIGFSVPSLDNLINGSINVDRFAYNKGNSIQDNDKFILYSSNSDAKYASMDANPKYVVMLSDDTMGLNEGTKVYYRGIEIGQVIKIPWFKDNSEIYDVKSRIPALIVLNSNKEDADKAKETFDSLLKQKKLCAVIGSDNFISYGKKLNFVINNKSCKDSLLSYRDQKVVPFRADKGVMDEINEFAKKLNAVDVDNIADNLTTSLSSLNKTLVSINRITNTLEKEQTVSKFTNTIEGYNKQGELYQSLLNTLNSIDNSVKDIRPTLIKLGQKSNSLVFDKQQNDPEPKVK
ncbi:MAG: intermembrane transport protein PqiB [Succinivibrio sp.]